MNTLILLAIGGITLTAGDIIFKLWVERSAGYWSLLYIGGLCIYLVGLVFLVESFKTKHIAIATAIFVICNLVTLSLVSWWYFGEKLSAVEIAGLLLAGIAIVLLEMKEWV